jgi:Ras GTPase-activating-like protein IQGAP2/3
MPFTKQFFHMHKLQRTGKEPKFGSFIYSGQELWDKGILLSMDQFSPRQFDRISLVMESDEVGIFTIKLTSTVDNYPREIATQDLRMDDLLQANFEGKQALGLFDNMAKVNLNLLLFQINKKYVVTL